MSLSDTDTNTPINTMGDGEHLPGRSLHVCATPWRPGQRTAPVQLREGPTQVTANVNSYTCSCVESFILVTYDKNY